MGQSIPVLGVFSDPSTGIVSAGSGEVDLLSIDIREGNGDVLINTNTLLQTDWQSTAREAVSQAQLLTHRDLSSKDVIFTIKGASPEIGGPSGGGAMTVLLVSELEGKTINNYTAMTGTINPDGTIGPVGGVIEKAFAAGRAGTKVMLVPAGQGYYPSISCPSDKLSSSFSAPARFNTCVLQELSLSDLMDARYGMKVVQIHNIQEALNYFQSNNNTNGNNQTSTTGTEHDQPGGGVL